MKKYTYSNGWETYEIHKIGKIWIVEQDGVPADKKFKSMKEAKQAIDNQEIYF